jgi:hypothetical protein
VKNIKCKTFKIKKCSCIEKLKFLKQKILKKYKKKKNENEKKVLGRPKHIAYVEQQNTTVIN